MDLLELFDKWLEEKEFCIAKDDLEWYKETLRARAYRGIISATKYTYLNKLIFPEKPKSMRPYTYLAEQYGYKFCSNCQEFLPIDNFRKKASARDGLQSFCKFCHSDTTAQTQKFRQATYRSKKIQATPIWANLDKISEIYSNCPVGYHVDPIIPLNNADVCGLHCEDNLQYLLASDNMSKSNKFDTSL